MTWSHSDLPLGTVQAPANRDKCSYEYSLQDLKNCDYANISAYLLSINIHDHVSFVKLKTPCMIMEGMTTETDMEQVNHPDS